MRERAMPRPRRLLGLAARLLVMVSSLASFQANAQGPSRAFHASVRSITAAEQATMNGRSWHEGCPVQPIDLASIRVSYIGYDAKVHDGVLVIHRKLANEAVQIFRELFAAGFRIERMQPYEDFPTGAYAAHNDTVGFYCRPAQDDPKNFSTHAYGFAIDINPMTNPYLDAAEGWWPADAAVGSGRDRVAPGLLTARSSATRILMSHGWSWGGLDRDNPDYMHFGKVTVGSERSPAERQVWVKRLRYAP